MSATFETPFVRFATNVLGLRLTRGQRVLCMIAFDGLEPSQLEGEDREIARAMFGDIETVPPTARVLLVLILGRGSGKTTLAAAFALYTMWTADVSACGPGDVPTVVTIAPSMRTARLSVRMALELARRTPVLKRALQKETGEGFSLKRADDDALVAFEAFAASRGGHTARGISILAAILDESWFFLSDQGGTFVVNDRDIYRAISPRLLPSGKVLFISTPWPVETLTGDLFDKNFEAPKTALVARAPTLLMRDNAPDVVRTVAREREIDPDNAAREFDCELGSLGSSSFFDSAALEAAVERGRPAIVVPPVGLKLAAGADIALVRDSSALVLVGGSKSRAEVIHMMERRPKKGAPLKLSELCGDMADVLNAHRVSTMMADGFVRLPAREWLQPRGVTIKAAPEGLDGKAQTYTHLRKALNEGRVVLPDHPRLIGQLRAITSKPLAGGRISIQLPRRVGQGHCDLVSALVLAFWNLDSPRVRHAWLEKWREADQRDRELRDLGFESNAWWRK